MNIRALPDLPYEPLPPASRGVAMVDLKACQCRWPVNNAPWGGLHLFCGAVTAAGDSYCPAHKTRARGTLPGEHRQRQARPARRIVDEKPERLPAPLGFAGGPGMTAPEPEWSVGRIGPERSPTQLIGTVATRRREESACKSAGLPAPDNRDEDRGIPVGKRQAAGGEGATHAALPQASLPHWRRMVGAIIELSAEDFETVTEARALALSQRWGEGVGRGLFRKSGADIEAMVTAMGFSPALLQKALGALEDGDFESRAERIIRRTCRLFGVKRMDLMSARQGRTIATARQFAMHWIKRLTPLSYPQIGRMFNGRDHTTALHGVRVWPDKRGVARRIIAAARLREAGRAR